MAFWLWFAVTFAIIAFLGWIFTTLDLKRAKASQQGRINQIPKPSELVEISGVGPALAEKIHKWLKNYFKSL